MYKFGFIILGANDYLRHFDTTVFEIDNDNFSVQFDNKGRAYILDNVNQVKVNRLLNALAEKNIEIEVTSVAKWKELPDA